MIWELIASVPNWGWLLIGLVLLFYVGGPLATMRTIRIEAEPSLTPARSLPDEASRFFRSLSGSLADEGFRPAPAFVAPFVAANVAGLACLMGNPDTGDIVLAVTNYVVKQGAALPKSQYVEFMTRFEDGSSILTGNSREITAFAPVASIDSIQLPQVVSPSVLYRIHRARIEQSPKNRLSRTFPKPGDELAFAGYAIVESVEQQVERGILRRSGASFVPTLFGAFYMTWRELPPMKQIRVA